MNTAQLQPPDRMARLPRDRHGRLAPWFIASIDGEPDHRVVRAGGIEDAFRFNICWLCGQTLGSYKTFVIGPMCVMNRTTGEPPSHRDCAEYAAQACPFLTHPNMRRRPDLPEDTVPPDGEMDPRNPGVCVTWTTRSWSRKPGMTLFTIGDATSVDWWKEGRPATYGEALDALMSGQDLLKEKAEKDRRPLSAVQAVKDQFEVAVRYLPGNFAC